MIWFKKEPNLKVLLICDPSVKSKPDYEDAVWGIGGLELAKTVSIFNAYNHLKEIQPDIVWLEFSPDHDKSKALFKEILQDYPNLYFILSDLDFSHEFLNLKEKTRAQFFIIEDDWRLALPPFVKRAKENLYKK